MGEQLPVVRVRREGGREYRIINERDFDPAVHVLYDEAAKVTAVTEVDACSPVDEMPQVRRRGRPPKVREQA